MAKYQPTPIILAAEIISRRSVLLWGLIVGVAGCNKTANWEEAKITTRDGSNLATPRQTEGPFYPIKEQSDKDNDLTRVQGKSQQAQGEVIMVEGRVTDTNGRAIANVLVEIWQANTWGRYSHQRDPNAAPLDPDFQGWGQTRSDAHGRYQFKTIRPGAYPAGPGWTRPPHIHFKVSSPGYFPLTTQMYFPDQALNQDDLILQNVPQTQQAMVIAKRQAGDDNGEPLFRFDIALLKKPE